MQQCRDQCQSRLEALSGGVFLYYHEHQDDHNGDDYDDDDMTMMMTMTTMMMMMRAKVNTMAVMEATEVVMERMSGRGGLIVNTASLAGVMMVVIIEIMLTMMIMMMMTMIMIPIDQYSITQKGIVSSTGNGGHASYPYFASKHAVVKNTFHPKK